MIFLAGIAAVVLVMVVIPLLMWLRQ